MVISLYVFEDGNLYQFSEVYPNYLNPRRTMEYIKSGRGGKRSGAGQKPDGHKRVRLMLKADYEIIYKNISKNYLEFDNRLKVILNDNEDRKFHEKLKETLEIIGIKI
jgi:hypothetical protein